MIAKIALINFTAILPIFLIQYINAEYDVAKYCQLVPVGTKFPAIKSCQTFYTCLSNGQVTENNCPTNHIFDKDSQLCVSTNSDNCYNKNPCENMNGVWVPDIQNCRYWKYCINGNIMGSGSCPFGQIFDYASQRCINGECKNSEINEIKNLCEIMPNGQYFADFSNCTIWHKCHGTVMKTGTCSNNLIYSPRDRMCIYNNKNICVATGGLSSLQLGGPDMPCTQSLLVGDTKVCSVYYNCTLPTIKSQMESKFLWWGKRTTTMSTPTLTTTPTTTSISTTTLTTTSIPITTSNPKIPEVKWQIYYCGTNQYFDSVTKTCTDRSLAKPREGCDRCQYASTTWVNVGESNCTKFYTCFDGNKIAESYCKTGYLNEEQQYCTAMNEQPDKTKPGVCKA